MDDEATPVSGVVGPSKRLPPVDTMVQLVTSEESMVPPLQGRAVARYDVGLVSSLLAAADFLRSPQPSSPAAPPMLLDEPSVQVPAPDDVDLGGLTMAELSEFLPVGSELPLSLDTPWPAQAQPPLPRAEEAAPTPTPSLDYLVTSLDDELPPATPCSPAKPCSPDPEADASSSRAPTPPVFAASSPAVSPAPAESPHATSPAPVASPRAVSPAPAVSGEESFGSEEEDDEGDEDDPDPYAAVNLIAAAASIKGRPPLPSPPERHPPAHWWNHVNPAAPVDPEAVYPIKKLIDRWGTPPHVAYLVEWQCGFCELSWEWPENLSHVTWRMDQGNKWKAADTGLSFNAYYNNNFRGAGKSKKNRCFLYAFQAACYGLGRPGLVNKDHWKRFCLQQNNSFPNDVVAGDIDKFFNFIRNDGVLLDYVELFKVHKTESMWTADHVEKVVRKLPSGYYIVHAAQDLVEHCFTLVLQGPDDLVLIYDDYNEKTDPPYRLEPLKIRGWPTHTCALYRLALPRPKRHRKPKKKKNSKKSRLSRN